MIAISGIDMAIWDMLVKAAGLPLARLPFDDKYKPDGWSYKQQAKFNNGRPDVVFMVYDPATV